MGEGCGPNCEGSEPGDLLLCLAIANLLPHVLVCRSSRDETRRLQRPGAQELQQDAEPRPVWIPV